MILLYMATNAMAEEESNSKHRFVSVCKQVTNKNIYDASPSEQAIYSVLKGQYFLEDCDLLWQFINQQERLVITNQEIKDFHLLDGHNHLLYLNIEGNALAQSESLPNIPQLRYLNLSHNKLQNFQNAPEYPQLKTLLVNHNALNNIEDIMQYPTLEWIDISSNEVVNIWPVHQLQELKTFYASDNNISNILPLFNLESVISLALNDNPIRFCPRGTWTRVDGQRMVVPAFIQHYCIHLRQQETKAIFKNESNTDEQQE